jgi:hypothetical protein
MMDQNVKTLEGTNNRIIENQHVASYLKADTLKFLKNREPREHVAPPAWFPALISFSYALPLAIGSILWFVLLGVIIARFRQRINLKMLNGIIHGLGILLGLFGLFFAYTAIRMLV